MDNAEDGSGETNESTSHRIMTAFTVEVPEGEERGIRVRCEDHGESEEFQPGYRTVAFYCEGCGYEVEITLHDTHDWRDLGEMC
ncbi:MAG: hypothetical protein ACI9YT_000130 [Halobacteriales archaeon]|jgi:uncharacterized protein (DUF983 family)